MLTFMFIFEQHPLTGVDGAWSTAPLHSGIGWMRPHACLLQGRAAEALQLLGAGACC